MSKKTEFIRIDFINCVEPDYGYTIIREMKEARDFLEHEVIMDKESSIKMYNVYMTERQYEKFIEQCERNA